MVAEEDILRSDVGRLSLC